MSGASDYLSPEPIAEWRKHTDLFSAVHAHERGSAVYLTTGEITEAVGTHDVTPGLLEALGVAPSWGRLLQPGDEQPNREPVAVIREDLARQLFGDPARAVGSTIQSREKRVQIVGVMPLSFRFPTSRERIWQPLDLTQRPSNYGVRGLFKLAPDAHHDVVARAVTERAPAVARASNTPYVRKQTVTAVPLAAAAGDARARLTFIMLIGAAVCVLLIACANVASLELASAMTRARSYAIHAALGATRATLVRVGLMEGALLLGMSAGLGGLLARWGVDLLTWSLPPTMVNPLANPIDLDVRALGFMVIAAAVAWLLTSVPLVRRATRGDLIALLKRDNRTQGALTGGGLRQALMAGQVALTVMLLIGAALMARTYAARVALEKGFDSSGVASVQVFPQVRSGPKAIELDRAILSRLKAQPGVRAVSRTSSVPPSTEAGIGNYLFVEGRARTDQRIKLSGYSVDPDYFPTLGIRMVAGRTFHAGDPQGFLVVDERFARRFWPDGTAVGARFNMGGAGWSGAKDFEIIGVAAAVRVERTETLGGDEVFVAYARIPTTYPTFSFVARLEDGRQLGALASLVRSSAPGAVVRTELVETHYRRLFGDVQLAASVTGGFGVLAFFVAMAGVYGVMAFLVTVRRKEIGVRLALGANARDIRRIFLRSSARLVVAGAALGAVGALVASQSLASMLFGVEPADPPTFCVVLSLVIATALIATWIPARQAAHVDPMITLRDE